MFDENRMSFCPRESILEDIQFFKRTTSKEVPSLFRGNDGQMFAMKEDAEVKKKKYFLAKRIESGDQSQLPKLQAIASGMDEQAGTNKEKCHNKESSFGGHLEFKAFNPKRDFAERKSIIPKGDNLQEKTRINTNNRSLDSMLARNIFQTAQTAPQFQIKFKGPSYDDKGQVVARSIVGQAEWFTKRDRQNGYFDRERLKEFGELNGHKGSILGVSNSVSSLSIKRQMNQSTMMGKSKKNMDSDKIRKTQLIDEISRIRDRIQKNQAIEECELDSLKNDKKLKATREQRILESHEETEVQWQKFMKNTAKELQRDVGYSMLVRQDQYRNMRDATDAITLSKSDLERFGQRHWQTTLRNYSRNRNEISILSPGVMTGTNGEYEFKLPNRHHATEKGEACEESKSDFQVIRKPFITDPIANIMNEDNSSSAEHSHRNKLQLQGLSESFYNSTTNSSRLFETNSTGMRKQAENKSRRQSSNPMFRLSNTIVPKKVDIIRLGDSCTEGFFFNRTNHSCINQSSLLGNDGTNSSFAMSKQLSQPFQSFQAKKYYEKRVNEIKPHLKNYITLVEQNVDFPGLAVVGESQLEKEISMVNRAENNQVFLKSQPIVESYSQNEDLFA